METKIEYFPNGEKRFEYQTRNGREHGIFIYWEFTGSIIMIDQRNNDNEHRPEIRFKYEI